MPMSKMSDLKGKRKRAPRSDRGQARNVGHTRDHEGEPEHYARGELTRTKALIKAAFNVWALKRGIDPATF
jgi:hypothetical protein